MEEEKIGRINRDAKIDFITRKKERRGEDRSKQMREK